MAYHVGCRKHATSHVRTYLAFLGLLMSLTTPSDAQKENSTFFESLNWTSSYQEHSLHWDALRGRRGEVLPVSYTGEQFPFHWAITACPRRHWSRYLTSTLVSAFANGLKPLTVTIVWCQPISEMRKSSFVYNLRHSINIKMIFLPNHLAGLDNWQKTVVATYQLALTVPSFYGRTDVPLMITEDDVIFAPNINLRLSQVISSATLQANQKPYFVTLYVPARYAPVEHIMEDLSKVQMRDREQNVSLKPYTYGGQATFFSPAMARFMALHFAQTISADRVEILQDSVLSDFLDRRFNCSSHDSTFTSAPCAVFSVAISLVQHAGTMSSLWRNASGHNFNFHMTHYFPFRVAMPGDDPQYIW